MQIEYNINRFKYTYDKFNKFAKKYQEAILPSVSVSRIYLLYKYLNDTYQQNVKK